MATEMQGVGGDGGGDAPGVARYSSLDWIAFKELSAHLSRPQDRFSEMCFLPELQIQQAR